MTALPCRYQRGRKSRAWVAPLAWLLAGAALMLLAVGTTPPRPAEQPPLFWIGQTRPLPLPPTASAAPPAAGERQP